MKFYLRTLGYTHDTFIRNIFKSVNEQNKVLASPDKRCQHEPIHKLRVDEIENIRKHMSYNPSINHYRRKHAPNRLYLSPELTITSMHGDYNSNEEVRKISYTRYENEL